MGRLSLASCSLFILCLIAFRADGSDYAEDIRCGPSYLTISPDGYGTPRLEIIIGTVGAGIVERPFASVARCWEARQLLEAVVAKLPPSAPRITILSYNCTTGGWQDK